VTLVGHRMNNKLKFVKVQKDKTDPAFINHVIYTIELIVKTAMPLTWAKPRENYDQESKNIVTI